MLNKIKCAIGLHTYRIEYREEQMYHTFTIKKCVHCGKQIEQIRYYK